MRASARTVLLAGFVSVALAGPGVSLAQATTPPADPPKPPDNPNEVVKDTPSTDKISTHSQELLAQAEASGKARVTVMALAEPGRAGDVAARLSELGGIVGYRHDRTGYVRASLPTGKVLQAATLSSVETLDLDELVQVPKPVADDGRSRRPGSMPWTGPNDKTPNDNPYLPTRETGAIAFKTAHPEFDGRNITIGILDSGVDLDHPALQKTSTGENKIVDWGTATDPLLESDGTWRPMLTSVSGPTATFNNVTWTLPAGDYLINTFKESAAARSDEIVGDINRDGDTTDSWGILYNPKTGDIRVDSDGNNDFTDNPVMRPFAEKRDVGHFGTDNPKTAVREQMPFVVEFRKGIDLTPAGLAGRKADFVNIGLVSSAHGTHVAGIAAGKGLFGGAMDGAAPGAKIVSAKACVFEGGCTSTALTEGMIDLVANKRVDVVNMSIGGLPALNDGNTTRTQLYQRLIDEYGVQLFISAGNSGPGVNTIGDPALATDVVSVGASASKETWKANYGADVTAPLWVQNYSSRGPREDGGFTPALMAPGSAISTIPSFMEAEDLADVSYKLPPGYSMFNGTSMASPQAAGAAALLLSGARATDQPVVPRQLRTALFSSASFVPGLDAVAQGHGQIDIIGAWDLLSKGIGEPSDYAISAPVCSPLSERLAEKNVGTGVYNRCAADAGGHKIGQSRTYAVTITRTGGDAADRRHTLRWVGNDGTFDSPGQVDLPLGKARTVKVTARPATAGSHSAYLAIDSAATPGLDASMMTQVIVGTGLGAAPYNTSDNGPVERARTRSIFVTVPENAGALQVNLSRIAPGSQVRFLAINPLGLPVEKPRGKLTCYTGDGDPKLCPPTSRAYLNPLPGVWEIQVEARRTTPFTTNPYRLTAAAQGVRVTPAEQQAAGGIGGKIPVSWNVTNSMGAVTVSGTGGPLGSAATLRPTIKTGEKQMYRVQVPQGASQLDVRIGNPSDPSADLDLVVRDENEKEVASSAGGDSEERVTLTDPKPGLYYVEVVGYAVNAAGGTQYDYRDVFYSAGLGRLDVAGRPAPLAFGATRSLTGTITPLADPTPGRSLFGEMKVVSGENAVLATGRVVVTAPTPEPTPTETATPTPTGAGTPTPTPTGTGTPPPGAPTSLPAPPPGPTPTGTLRATS